MSCRPGESHLAHDLVVAVLATIVFMALSLPAHWSFDFWGERAASWAAHFAVGAALCVYVVVAFLRALRTLLGHEHGEEEASDEPS